MSEVDLQENISTQVSRAVERNNACQIGNRCAKMGGGGGSGRRRGNEEDVEAAEMTHIGVTRYEFAMMLLGLLAHGWGARGDGRCTVGYLG